MGLGVHWKSIFSLFPSFTPQEHSIKPAHFSCNVNTFCLPVCVLIFSSLSKDIELNVLMPGEKRSELESEGLTLIITCIDLCALEEKLLVPEQPTMNGY